jgi:hypothetical protein
MVSFHLELFQRYPSITFYVDSTVFANFISMANIMLNDISERVEGLN